MYFSTYSWRQVMVSSNLDYGNQLIHETSIQNLNQNHHLVAYQPFNDICVGQSCGDHLYLRVFWDDTALSL